MTIIIGKIYAEWCGYCQMLKPQWDEMKEKIDSKTQIIDLEIGEKKKLNDLLKKYPKLEVSGYPTIFKIKNENIEYYSGDRSANDLLIWASKKGRKSKGIKTKKGRKSKGIKTKKGGKSKKKINRKSKKRKVSFLGL
jgi:thiol-disulfide isomerase/thioredoxin